MQPSAASGSKTPGPASILDTSPDGHLCPLIKAQEAHYRPRFCWLEDHVVRLEAGKQFYPFCLPLLAPRLDTDTLQRIWVTYHLDAPVPWARGLAQAEEGNRRQVWMRDVRVGSIQWFLQAWRGWRGTPGPRLLSDSRLRVRA